MKRKLILVFIFFVLLINNIQAQEPRIAFEAAITRQVGSPRSPLHFDVIKYNEGSAFSPSASVFVAPTNGVYFFSANLLWNGFGCGYVGGTIKIAALRNGRDTLQCINRLASYREWGPFSTNLSFSTKLNAGDRVSVTSAYTFCTSVGGSAEALLYNGVFSGYRVYAE